MAMNPLIDGLLTDFTTRNELADVAQDDRFEMFAGSLVLGEALAEQVVLSDLLLDPDVVGLDVIAIELNGQLAWDPDDVADICSNSAQVEVVVHFVQAKRSESVSSTDILGMAHAAKSFLEGSGVSAYPKLQALSQGLSNLFANFAGKIKTQPVAELSFVTTASKKSTMDDVVLDRLKQATEVVADVGFVGTCNGHCLGADDLHSLYVQQNHANEADIHVPKQVTMPEMPGVEQAIVGLVSLSELLNLVSLPDGSLNERVFFDNVRGFQGESNSVNRQILETLGSDAKSLLPVLNNGVTVVARSYSTKPGDHLHVADYQIVNGCQTSHCAYLVKEELGEAAKEVFVPLRLVVTSDEDVATRIIRATNSQTEVKENDLAALSKFQKQLEDFYRLDSAGVGLTYERRGGQYYGATVVKTRLVNLTDQMRSAASMLLDRPHYSSRYPNKLWAEVGGLLFQEGHKLLPYVASAYASYRLENAFRTGLDAKYKAARYHILMVMKYQVLNTGLGNLDQAGSQSGAQKLIDALQAQKQVELFQSAAQVVEQVGGGDVPTRDRLKRQQFTSELLMALHGGA